MTDKPIIFSAPMVQALLAGRKSQTRRLLNPQPDLNDAGLWRYPPDSVCNGVDPKLWVKRFGGFCQTDAEGLASFLLHPSNGRRLLPYAPGDRLYVREAFSYETLDVDRNGFMPPWYWADGNLVSGDFSRPKPSIHMPRWASRLTLPVTEVRVQRLQEISEADAVAEGVLRTASGHFDYHEHAEIRFTSAVGAYRDLWNSLHGPDAWATNPWVVAVSFTVQNGNIDAVKSNA